jgi:hypothetical protein
MAVLTPRGLKSVQRQRLPSLSYDGNAVSTKWRDKFSWIVQTLRMDSYTFTCKVTENELKDRGSIYGKAWSMSTTYSGRSVNLSTRLRPLPSSSGTAESLWTCIQQVLGSNVGRKPATLRPFIGYSVPESKCGILPPIDQCSYLPHSLQFIIHPTTGRHCSLAD